MSTTNWKLASELTPEIVESAWRLIVWDGSETWTFEEYLSDDGEQELVLSEDGVWYIDWMNWITPSLSPTHFAVIDAPPDDQ